MRYIEEKVWYLTTIVIYIPTYYNFIYFGVVVQGRASFLFEIDQRNQFIVNVKLVSNSRGSVNDE